MESDNDGNVVYIVDPKYGKSSTYSMTVTEQTVPTCIGKWYNI